MLHGLGVLDELLQHQEPATAITFASPSFRTLFSVPDSIVCFGLLTSSSILSAVSPANTCLRLLHICDLSTSATHLRLVSSCHLSDVLLGTALPSQSSALPINQYDSFALVLATAPQPEPALKPRLACMLRIPPAPGALLEGLLSVWT